MQRLINLTDKRVEILRFVARADVPVYASYVAEECLPRPAMSTGRSPGYSRQQATRTGAGALRPLAEAGLVKVRMATVGWGTAEITEAGRSVLRAFDREDGTLEQALERAAAGASACHSWKPRQPAPRRSRRLQELERRVESPDRT